MTPVFLTVLSMSGAGSIMIGVICLLRKIRSVRLDIRLRYYLWLFVVARLLIPGSASPGVLGHLETWCVSRTLYIPESSQTVPHAERIPDPAPRSGAASTAVPATADIGSRENLIFADHDIGVTAAAWVWFVITCILLGRSILQYLDLSRSLYHSSTPAPDIWRRYAAHIAQNMSIQRRVDLRVCNEIRSPVIFGLLRPMILVPPDMLNHEDFANVIIHEFVHLRRIDTVYKWAVQAALCAHWFNPLVRWMACVVQKEREMSCDAAATERMNAAQRHAYGTTLLRAAGCDTKTNAVVSLSNDAKRLKERLEALMLYRSALKPRRFAAFAAVLILLCTATAAGAYDPAQSGIVSETAQKASTSAAYQVRQFYDDGNIAGFNVLFPRLSVSEQLLWLYRTYVSGKTAFFGTVVRTLHQESRLPSAIAERAYRDSNIVCFSIIADSMDDGDLNRWLTRARDDNRWAFTSVLLNRMNKTDELDELEAELLQQQIEEYRSVGIETNGSAYYYDGQLVNVLLDLRDDSSCYTLQINAAGTISVRVERDADGRIVRVSTMSDAEVIALLQDLADD